MRFIALDIESTGVDPRKDRIIELHAREVTFPFLDSISETTFTFDPGVPIPPEATAVNGFTNDKVAECVKFSDAAGQIQALLNDSRRLSGLAPAARS